MAKVVAQEILSKIRTQYDAACITLHGSDRVLRRLPKHFNQPNTTRQRKCRSAFLNAIWVWKQQPETGGAIPPAWGPRGRDWWAADAPYYYRTAYNWFMHETMQWYLPPPWGTYSTPSPELEPPPVGTPQPPWAP